jgi:hypothetical protein
MSEVELCSTFTGPVGITTKQGKHSTVTFFEKHDESGPIGFAIVNHEQAEQFLKIPSEYWKPGARGAQPVSTKALIDTALANDPVASAAADKLFGGQTREELKEELRKELAAEAAGGKPLTGLAKANAAKKAAKAEKEAAKSDAAAPLIEALKLAETPEEVDAVVFGAAETPELVAAVAERKGQLTAE